MGKNSLCIVLRASNYKESDKMLTLFSQDWGRIDALARGCRKPASSLLSSCDVFCCATFSFNVSNDRYYITQAELKNNFFSIRKNMQAMMMGMLLLEITEKTVMPEQPNARMFALLASALHALSENAPPKKVFIFFVFKLLDILGLKPELDVCVLCGNMQVSGFNLAAGGTVCQDCPGETLSTEHIAAIRKIFQTPSRSMLAVALPYDEVIYDLALRLLTSTLEYEPKTLLLLQ
ncbi:MAG: DNA repair protein RecO [Christensenellaceae bacterium]|jgi:DNA repair protein RecO (recombination protein O)